MAEITQQDYEAVLACVARLHECNSVERFPYVALEEVPKLVGADHTTFNYVAPSVPKVIVLTSAEVPEHTQRQEVFAKYLSDQPVLNHYLATGDPRAYKLSDFVSVRQYHALPLYKHLYHDLRYEDQFAFMFYRPGAETISIALARDRRSFTERDRRVLNLLRPHIAQAYRHAQQIAGLNRALFQTEPTVTSTPVTTILLDQRNRPVQFGAKAQRWIAHFFPDRPRDASHLPAPVMEWLQRSRRFGYSPQAPMSREQPLVRERDGQRLRLRLFPGTPGKGRVLVLGLETILTAAHPSAAGKLTRREIEVLIEVEQGKTNEEIAATLGISPFTVRTHLENIFEKLHVSSRTAAVTRFRRACFGSGWDETEA